MTSCRITSRASRPGSGSTSSVGPPSRPRAARHIPGPVPGRTVRPGRPGGEPLPPAVAADRGWCWDCVRSFLADAGRSHVRRVQVAVALVDQGEGGSTAGTGVVRTWYWRPWSRDRHACSSIPATVSFAGETTCSVRCAMPGRPPCAWTKGRSPASLPMAGGASCSRSRLRGRGRPLGRRRGHPRLVARLAQNSR